MVLGLIGVTSFLSFSLLAWGLFRPRKSNLMGSRIESFRERAITPVEGETDFNESFSDRVIRPAIEGLARMGTSVLPATMLAGIERRLIMAGNPMKINAFVAMWVSVGVLFVSVMLVGVVLVGGTVGMQQALVVLVFGVIGVMLPIIWLRSRVRARQHKVLLALPDALDLITTCVEAGLGLDAALTRVNEKSSGPLAEEMSRTLREIAMGRLRRDALLDMGDRTGVEELIMFISAIIQAEQMGVSIAQVLRVQAEQLRTRRRQQAEQAAHEAPIKMIFPLVLFIFPAFLLVILGPAMIRISQSLL
jgi:tight adherence protein C